eukprot:scaffold803_cov310-Pinguiococcus_pyrenoidosus.AAC.43
MARAQAVLSIRDPGGTAAGQACKLLRKAPEGRLLGRRDRARAGRDVIKDGLQSLPRRLFSHLLKDGARVLGSPALLLQLQRVRMLQRRHLSAAVVLQLLKAISVGRLQSAELLVHHPIHLATGSADRPFPFSQLLLMLFGKLSQMGLILLVDEGDLPVVLIGQLSDSPIHLSNVHLRLALQRVDLRVGVLKPLAQRLQLLGQVISLSVCLVSRSHDIRERFIRAFQLSQALSMSVVQQLELALPQVDLSQVLGDLRFGFRAGQGELAFGLLHVGSDLRKHRREPFRPALLRFKAISKGGLLLLRLGEFLLQRADLILVHLVANFEVRLDLHLAFRELRLVHPLQLCLFRFVSLRRLL